MIIISRINVVVLIRMVMTKTNIKMIIINIGTLDRKEPDMLSRVTMTDQMLDIRSITNIRVFPLQEDVTAASKTFLPTQKIVYVQLGDYKIVTTVMDSIGID